MIELTSNLSKQDPGNTIVDNKNHNDENDNDNNNDNDEENDEESLTPLIMTTTTTKSNISTKQRRRSTKNQLGCYCCWWWCSFLMNIFLSITLLIVCIYYYYDFYYHSPTTMTTTITTNETSITTSTSTKNLLLQQEYNSQIIGNNSIYSPQVVYGLIHVAKTAGTEINGALASRLERICGNKGYSYNSYQANIAFARHSDKVNYYNDDDIYKDLISKSYEYHNRGRIPPELMEEIGWEDCDYIAMEDPWTKWIEIAKDIANKVQNVKITTTTTTTSTIEEEEEEKSEDTEVKNTTSITMTNNNNDSLNHSTTMILQNNLFHMELHLPCRDPLDHAMSMCNQVKFDNFSCILDDDNEDNDNNDNNNNNSSNITTTTTRNDWKTILDETCGIRKYVNPRFSMELVPWAQQEKLSFTSSQQSQSQSQSQTYDEIHDSIISQISCFAPIPNIEPYLKYMSQKLQPKSLPNIYHHRDTNRPRNKSNECIFRDENQEFASMVKQYLIHTYDYYKFCDVCMGSEYEIAHYES